MTSFAPYPVHPMVPLNLDMQIPKRGDQRQMENWQRVGTYTAGLALGDAGDCRQRRDPRRAPTSSSARAAASAISPSTRRSWKAFGSAPVAGRVPQRAPLQRPPPDAFPRAAPQPPRRQHRHRPQGHRLVAHPPRRGKRRRRGGRDRRAAHPRRPGRHLPGRRHRDRRAQGRAPHPDRRRLGLEGRADIGLGAAREGRRRGHRLGRRLPRPRGARACRGPRQEALRPARTGLLRPQHAPPRRSRGQRQAPVRGDHGGRPPSSGRRPLGRHRHRRADARGARLPRRIDRRRRGGYGQVDREPARQQHRVAIRLRDRARGAALSRRGFYRPTDETGFETPLAVPPKAIVVTTWGIWRGEGMGLVEAVE